MRNVSAQAYTLASTDGTDPAAELRETLDLELASIRREVDSQSLLQRCFGGNFETEIVVLAVTGGSSLLAGNPLPLAGAAAISAYKLIRGSITSPKPNGGAQGVLWALSKTNDNN